MRKNKKLSKLRTSTMKIETLEQRQLLGHAADLLVLGDADLVDHGTPFMGNTYNGFEQTSEVASYQATSGELTRVSFLDPDGDLVFVEFGGAGTMNIQLEGFMADVDSPYDQPGTTYSQGLATITITGSDQTTFVSVFSLGNDPARVDLALVNDDTFATADGRADIRAIVIEGTDAQVDFIGGINAANADLTDNGGTGPVGIFSAEVRIDNYLFIGEMSATGGGGRIDLDPFSLLTSEIPTLESDGSVLFTGGSVSTTPVTLENAFPIISIDGQLSIDSEMLIASRSLDTGDFNNASGVTRETDRTVTFEIDPDLDDGDARTTLADEQQEAFNDFRDNDFDPTNELIIDGDATGLVFNFGMDVPQAVIFTGDLDDVEIVGWSFSAVILEGDTNHDVLVSTDFNNELEEVPDGDDIVHNDVLDPNEGGIDLLMVTGDITGMFSVEGNWVNEVWFGTGSGGGFSGDVAQHASSSAIVFAFGDSTTPSSIGTVNTYAGDLVEDVGTADTADATTFAKLLDGSVNGNTLLFPNGLSQYATSGPLVHLVDSNVNDGVVRSGGTVDFGGDSSISNFFEYQSGTPDNDESTTVDESKLSETPDRGWVEVTGSGTLDFHSVFATSSGAGVLPNVTGISTDDGNITFTLASTNKDSPPSLWDLGLISAKGNNENTDTGTAEASVNWTFGIVVANNFEGIWADYDIVVGGVDGVEADGDASPPVVGVTEVLGGIMKVVGDIDDFHAGNAFMSASTGTIYASNINKIKAGGDLTIRGGITLDDGDIGPITAGKNVEIDSKIMAENVGLISASDGDVSISSGGYFVLTGDFAGITASGNISILEVVDEQEQAVPTSIMAQSVGDLTAGGKISIKNDIRANGIGNISAGTDLELDNAVVFSTDGVTVTVMDGNGDTVPADGNQPIGNISAGNKINFIPGEAPDVMVEVGFRGSTIGNISAGWIVGAESNVEFEATKSIGNVKVINGDANKTTTTLDNVPLLTDVIFQANDDIGDIWLQQDTVDQSIATASMASVAFNQGVGFAAGGSIGDVHIQGIKGLLVDDDGNTIDDTTTTIMADPTPTGDAGGLFILAGDDNAAEAGGNATADLVTIGTVTIQLNLSAATTFGGTVAGSTFVIAAGTQPTMAGVYATADSGAAFDITGVESTAGSIGDIVLNDISHATKSSLPKNPSTIVTATAEVSVSAPAIIIAEKLSTVTHQKVGDEQTVLPLDGTPFMTVLHSVPGPGADFAVGDLLIAVL
jgi:hypothetical protein